MPYFTNSNLRTSVKAGLYSPFTWSSWTSATGYTAINDFIGELLGPGESALQNVAGYGAFNFCVNLLQNGFEAPYYYAKFKFQGLSDIGIDSGIVMSTGKIWFYQLSLPSYNPDPGYFPGICHAASYVSGGGWGINIPFQQTTWFNSFLDEPWNPFVPDRFTQYPLLVGLNNGDSIADANILTFSFVPKGDYISLDYVFASEEWPSGGCSGGTDVMGIFLSGSGISGEQNIAVLPGTSHPVNPRTVYPPGSPCHPELNGAGSPYYVDNTGGQNVIYNGFTTVLRAAARVQPCGQYQLKVMLADGAPHPFFPFFEYTTSNPNGPGDIVDTAYSDSLWDYSKGLMLHDSGIFLKAGSLRSKDSVWVEALGGTGGTAQWPYAVRGCLAGKLRVRTDRVLPIPRQVQLHYGGSAQAGVDYAALPTTVTIPAGQDHADITVNALTLGSGARELEASVVNPEVCSGGPTYKGTGVLHLRDGYMVTALPSDTSVCPGCSVQLTASGESFLSYEWTPAAYLDNPSSAAPLAGPLYQGMVYAVKGVAPSGYPCQGGRDTVRVSMGTGISGPATASKRFKVYPNPSVGGKVSISLEGSSSGDVFHLSVYGADGVLAWRGEGTVASLNRSLSGFRASPGVYRLLLRDGSGNTMAASLSVLR